MSSLWWMQIHSRLSDGLAVLIFPAREVHQKIHFCRSLRLIIYDFRCVRTVYNFLMIKEKRLWNFLTVLSKSSRPSLLRSVLALVFGVLSTCWKVMAMTIRAVMLMYGREAQSKTKTASPATIPKSGERNRKIHSCMLYLISI